MSLYSGMSQSGNTVETICDLRSDTVTQPDDAMRAAIAHADVGDDVYSEDPSVTRLEITLADMLNKEAALFLPTGTQSNLAALMAHCNRGDEVIVGNNYHIYCDEAAGASVLAGISMCPVPVEKGWEIHPDTVTKAIKGDDPHYAQSRLLCLENTVGGQVITLDKMQTAAQAASDKGLAVHLDGARFFNATTALGCSYSELANIADTVSVCLSKGLGAPAGSVLIGDSETIKRARRHRKILGGSMRQAGILAAAGLYALEYNIQGLAEDHRRAAHLAKALIELNKGPVTSGSNMVFFQPAAELHAPLCKYMAHAGIKIGGQSPAIRMVLHGDVHDAELENAINAFQLFYQSFESS